MTTLTAPAAKKKAPAKKATKGKAKGATTSGEFTAMGSVSKVPVIMDSWSSLYQLGPIENESTD